MLTIGGGQVLRWGVRSSVSVPNFGLGCKLRARLANGVRCVPFSCAVRAFRVRRCAGLTLWVVLALFVGSCGRLWVVSILKLPTRNSLNRINIWPFLAVCG